MTRSLRRTLAVRFAATMALALATASAAIYVAASRVLEGQLDGTLVATVLGAVVLFGTLATFAGAWRLAGSAVRPVAEITELATHVEAGTLDLRIAAHADTQEYEGLVAVLNRMLERLDVAFRNQRRLTTDVSHELRSPLTVLRGEIEVALRSERSPQDYQRALRSSLEEIDHMIALTEELLLVTRADAHLIQTQREATDVNALVRRALGGLRGPVADKALVVEEALTAPPVAVDPGLIAHMVERLLDNAVKFAPQDGRLRVATAPLGTGLRLSVENSGTGIAPEHLPHVFEAFFRADQARTRDTGLGLGLTVAAAIARLHGGSIEASNVPTGGARFEVRLPGLT